MASALFLGSWAVMMGPLVYGKQPPTLLILCHTLPHAHLVAAVNHGAPIRGVPPSGVKQCLAKPQPIRQRCYQSRHFANLTLQYAI